MNLMELYDNELFREFRRLLEKRLEMHVRKLHHLISSSSDSFESETWKIAQIYAERALITEIEIILTLPLSQAPNTTRVEETKKSFSHSFLSLLRKCFASRDRESEYPVTGGEAHGGHIEDG